MKRGDLVRAVFSRDLGQPRPALVVQSDEFAGLPSIVLCPLTSSLEGAGPLRIQIEPDEFNRLERSSLVMIDKVAALSVDKIGGLIGRVTDEQLSAVSSRLTLLLALAP